jgi:hypothetical protein
LIITSVPSVIRDIANNTKDLCSKSFSVQTLIIFLTGIFFGLESFCDIKRMLIFSFSVSSLSRNASNIPHESLLRRTRNRVAKMLKEIPNAIQRFILITDDTLCRKFGIIPDNCYWFDHTTNTTFRGRNYLVIVLLDTYTGQCFPLSVILLYGKKHKEHKPRLEELKKELLILKDHGLSSFALSADSWFAGSELFEWLDENDFDFEIEIKRNRKITYLDKKQLGVIGEKGKMKYPSIDDVAMNMNWRNTAFSGGAPKKINSGIIRMYGSELRLKFSAVWNLNDSKHTSPFAIYVTNKTSRHASKIWALSRFRWSIECHFRASKQSFSFDKFPTHSSQIALKMIVLGMFLISSLEIQRFCHDAKPADKKTIRSKIEPIEKLVKKIRNEHENKNYLKILIQPITRESVINHIKTVRNKSFVCLKPRDKIKNKDQLDAVA